MQIQTQMQIGSSFRIHLFGLYLCSSVCVLFYIEPRTRETKDTFRVSLEEYLFTGSSKVSSCGFFWQKIARLSDLLEGSLTVLQEPTLAVLLVLPIEGHFVTLSACHLHPPQNTLSWNHGCKAPLLQIPFKGMLIVSDATVIWKWCCCPWYFDSAKTWCIAKKGAVCKLHTAV